MFSLYVHDAVVQRYVDAEVVVVESEVGWRTEWTRSGPPL